MSIRVIKVGTDMASQFAFASANINSFLNDGLVKSANSTARWSKTKAPIYNPLKWRSWRHMKNHHKTGGRLKKSIRVGKISYRKRGASVRIGSHQKYASYMEEGFHHVRQGGAWKPGKYFLRGSINVIFKRRFPVECDVAFLKAFGGQ